MDDHLKHQQKLLLALEKNPVEKHSQLLNEGARVALLEPGSPDQTFGDLRLIRRLGLGAHAEVYEAESHSAPGISVAIKIEKPIKYAYGILLREIELLKRLKECASVPKYLGAYIANIGGFDCLAMAQEMYDECLSSLKSVRDEISPSHLLQVIDWLAVQMFTSVFSLHESGYLHRDIKPSNFMFKLSLHAADPPHIGLIDFGSSIPVGEPNDSPFRGTGAYSTIDPDPLQSRPIDDYWSVAFSILDLCIAGGLPWRSTSGRTEAGREEIKTQKLDCLSTLVSLESVPPVAKELILYLFTSTIPEKPDGPVTPFISRVAEISRSMKVDSGVITNCLRLCVSKKLYIPTPLQKVPFTSLLLDKRYRSDLPSVRGSHVPFTLNESSQGPGNRILTAASSILYGIMDQCTRKNIPNPLVVDAGSICVLELTQGSCPARAECPLAHIPGKGIEYSSVVRWLHRARVCAESVVSQCKRKGCDKTHLSSDEICAIFQHGRAPPTSPKKPSSSAEADHPLAKKPRIELTP